MYQLVFIRGAQGAWAVERAPPPFLVHSFLSNQNSYRQVIVTLHIMPYGLLH